MISLGTRTRKFWWLQGVTAFQKQASIYDSVGGQELLEDDLLNSANDLSYGIVDAETECAAAVASKRSSPIEDCFPRFLDFRLEFSEREENEDEEVVKKEDANGDEDILP